VKNSLVIGRPKKREGEKPIEGADRKGQERSVLPWDNKNEKNTGRRRRRGGGKRSGAQLKNPRIGTGLGSVNANLGAHVAGK